MPTRLEIQLALQKTFMLEKVWSGADQGFQLQTRVFILTSFPSRAFPLCRTISRRSSLPILRPTVPDSSPLSSIQTGWKNQWRFLSSYCGWPPFEIGFVWFTFPETAGRTLEKPAVTKTALRLLADWPRVLLTFCEQDLKIGNLLIRPFLLSRRPCMMIGTRLISRTRRCSAAMSKQARVRNNIV